MNEKANNYMRDLFMYLIRKALNVEAHVKSGKSALLYTNWYEQLQNVYNDFRKVDFDFFHAGLLTEKEYEDWRIAAGTIYLEAMKMIEV